VERPGGSVGSKVLRPELEFLVCPHTGESLALAAAEVVDRVRNSRSHADHSTISALVNASETFAYPVVNDIPILLADEAIPL